MLQFIVKRKGFTNWIGIIEITDKLLGEEDMTCIVHYQNLITFFSPNIALGESELKRNSSNEDCEQETTTILLLFHPAHYPGQLGPRLQPANLK